MYMYMYMYICTGAATSSRTTHAHTTSNACIAGPPPLEIVVQVTLNPGQTKPNQTLPPHHHTSQVGKEKRKKKNQIKKQIKINRGSGQGGPGWRKKGARRNSFFHTCNACCTLHAARSKPSAATRNERGRRMAINKYPSNPL
ncbi:hypothetical protein I7I50_08688 [Histoplasma capsulatum G186AR]|uniref:Uncharacterized protein n=1 Tax=Ajellomyces capsulatus TaxID=5037 RepID=A0A8H7YQG7_AJECA|nr:hypothetical protein I7I52_06202 [Histoplasma capsulatum]QSS73789.1 hypothetical protein I7I50_08688 [Histoplasma capsulatum G186AR]